MRKNLRNYSCFFVPYINRVVKTKKSQLLKAFMCFFPFISAPAIALSFEEERRISEKTSVYSSNNSRADIAFNASGEGAVVWYNEEYVNSAFYERIYLQRLKQDGSAVGSVIVVSTDMDAEQKYPSVGIDAQGDIIVTWAITPEVDPLSVMARQYNSNGTAKGSEFQVHEDSDGNHYAPDLLVNSNGNFTVVWSSGIDDGFGDIYKRSFNADGSAIDTSTMVNTTTSHSQTNPVISANASGDMVIGWEAQGLASSWDIAFRVYDNNGQNLSSEIFANSDNYSGSQRDTAVAIDDLGNITVVWKCFCDGNGTGIKARRFDAFYEALTSSFTVNTYTENNQTDPAIAVQSDGVSLMTWTGRYTGQNGSSIFGQYFDTEGNLLGDEFIVSNAQTDSNNYFSRTHSVVHVDEHNIYRVAWSASQAGISNMGVFYNQAGLVSAGNDQVINSNSLEVNLLAKNNSPLDVDTWQWQQISGTSVTLINDDKALAHFQSPQENGMLVLKVSATFTDGSQASDLVNIEIAADIPDVTAGDSFSVLEGDTGFLVGDATATGSGNIATYLWKQISGPSVGINNSDSLNASFIAPSVTQDTILAFQLSVADTEGNEGQDQVSVTVENINQAPQVNAGADFASDENIVVNLNGLASDIDDNIVSYQWQQVSGPVVSLSNANSPEASFVAPEVTEGTTLSFTFTATDSEDASNSDSIDVAIQHVNKIPTVNAGSAQNVFDGELVQLSGNASDIDGSIVSYQWQQVSGTPVILINENSEIASFNAPEVTDFSELSFRLSVSDNEGAIAFSDTQVSVSDDETNKVPVVNAGPDQNVISNELVDLQGNASDDLGIQSIEWIQISGSAVVLNSTSNLNAQFTAPSVQAQENLVFRLRVTDIMELSSEDEITISVNPTSVNYCSLKGNSTSYEWIQSVTISGQQNVSNKNSGYGDFTSWGNINIQQGQDFSVSLQPGFRSGSSYNEYWYIWIDLNQDGQFDTASESVFTGSSRSTVNGNVTIPSSALLGSTRMRIAMTYGSSVPATCGQYGYGEVEDYTINIDQ